MGVKQGTYPYLYVLTHPMRNFETHAMPARLRSEDEDSMIAVVRAWYVVDGVARMGVRMLWRP